MGELPRIPWDDALTSYDFSYDPADRVDQAILATRRAVFPHHGLDPEY